MEWEVSEYLRMVAIAFSSLAALVKDMMGYVIETEWEMKGKER